MAPPFLPNTCFLRRELRSIDGNLDGFAEWSRPAGIGHPDNGIIRWIRIRVAEQIRKIDQTSRINAVFFHPLEYRAKIRPSAAFWLQLNRLRCPKLLDSLHRSVAIDHMNGLRLGFITDGGYLAGKLFQFFVANGTRSIYANDNGAQTSSCNGRQVQSGSDKAPVGWIPAIIGRRPGGHKIA